VGDVVSGLVALSVFYGLIYLLYRLAVRELVSTIVRAQAAIIAANVRLADEAAAKALSALDGETENVA
jgi:hypothetical protein